MTTTKTLGALVAVSVIAAAAPRPEMLVSTDWLSQHLTDSKVVILHVAANRAAYDAGHVPGARFLAEADIVVTRDGVPNELPSVADLKRVLEAAGVSDGSRVVLYGDTSVLPATRAYFTLDYLGHGDQAALLDGGLEKWRKEGRALSQEAPSSGQGTFTPHPHPELVAQMDQVKQMGKKSGSAPSSDVLLDVRSPADYGGEKGSHIPGALNLYWMENQVSRQDQTLKPSPELRKLYEDAGILPTSTVVMYCNSGMQASQSYFTLKYLGYDVKLYDGSMSEWKLKGGPVDK